MKNLHTQDGLWSKVPESWIQWDLYYQKKISAWSQEHPVFWEAVENFTENIFGMGTLFAVLLALVLFVQFHFQKQAPLSRGNLIFVICVSAGVGINDFLSNQLKHLFGRAKPFVEEIVEGKRFPLSFPSNHASNTSFLVVLLLLLLVYQNRKSMKKIHQCIGCLAGCALLLSISASRVFFGEHYPVDVIFGILWGSIFAGAYYKSCQAFVL